MSNWPLFREFTGVMTASSNSSEITLNISDRLQPVELHFVTVDMVTGSAATFQPTLGVTAGFVAGTVNERWTATSATNTNNRSDSNNIQRQMYTDSSGNLYFRPSPNTGSNNEFNYVIVIRPY